jgi:transporter family protein
MVAIFTTIFLGERPNMREWLGIVLVGVGVLILGFKR